MLTNPVDILTAYYPDTVTLGNQARLLEVTSGAGAMSRAGRTAPPGAFLEMTGDVDAHYEDFTSGLRNFVAARRSATSEMTGGGSTLVGGWFGGTGADPSAIVLGIDWLVGGDGNETLQTDLDEDSLKSLIVDAPNTETLLIAEKVETDPSWTQKDTASRPSDRGILSLIVDNNDIEGSEDSDYGHSKPHTSSSLNSLEY